MHLYSYPIPKLTIALICGIFLSSYVSIEIYIILFLLVVAFCFGLFFHFKTSIYKSIISSYFLLLLFVVLGVFISQLHHPKAQKNHYSYFLKKEKTSNLLLSITKEMSPTTYNYRYIAKVLEINHHNSNGTILVQTPKGSTINPYKTDDLVFLKGTLDPIDPPKNPYGFNYKNFLERKGIFHKISMHQNTTYITRKGKKSINGIASLARNFIGEKIDKLHINSTAQAFLKAFYLGKRDEILDEIKEDYKNSGVIHILALSGLHIGILLKILEFLLFPMAKTKKGKRIRSLLIIIALWSFAFVSGLSPSIVRAVTMFSCFALASGLNRQKNSINTLFISAFFLLIINPNYVLDVGFQLSYGAVLGILSITPILDRYWSPKHVLIKPLATLLKVSVAAQIGILPLGFYYFHQFPGLFFLANLLVVPALGLCLWMGVFIIILNGFKISEWLAYGFKNIIDLMNKSAHWIANFEFVLFKNITFDLGMLIVLYLIIIAFFKYITTKTFKKLMFFGISILLLQLYVLFTFKLNTEQYFIVFQKTKYTVLGFKNGLNFETHNTEKDNEKFQFIEDYTTNEGIEKKSNSNLNRFYSIGNKNLLVVDSLGYFDFKSIKFDWILLRNSPKINLEQLIKKIQPKLIIADGSNYKSYVRRWKKTCMKKNIHFHDTFEDAAFIYKLSYQGTNEGLNDL
jgi:competence protein ComEC